MKFYDVKSKKPVNIPDSQVSYETKSNRQGRMVTFATAIAPGGNKVYKIVANVARKK